MTQLRHFTRSEFDCPCCGRNAMSDLFLKRLDDARDVAGIPFVINSGYRCVAHNAEVNGVPNSSHLHGVAADIRCVDARSRWTIVNSLLTAGFLRLEIGPAHIHVDRDQTKAPWVIDLVSAHKGGGP